MDVVTSWQQLSQAGCVTGRLLALGLFTWSNYSRETRHSLEESEGLFNAEGIRLAQFTLGEPDAVLRVCPRFLRHFLFAVAEPACLYIVADCLVGVRFGPVTAPAILAWIRSTPTLPLTPHLSTHPHPELIVPSLKRALADDDPDMRAQAKELLLELQFAGEITPAERIIDQAQDS